jgi:uroporphyrinogen III methyltransferase/synthase
LTTRTVGSVNEALDQRNQPNPSDRPVQGVPGVGGVRRRFSAVLTRPGEQSVALARTLEAAGIEAIQFPLIDIRPNPDTREIDAALRGIDRGTEPATHRYALVFFVSPNAIEHAFGRAQALGVPLADALACRDGAWPIVAVVGPGSVQALARYGVRPGSHQVLAPAGALADALTDGQADAVPSANSSSNAELIRYDSEALVAALDATVGRAALAGHDVLIVRGDGGREWFADALRDAGARVHPVMAYQRAVPQPDETAWRQIEALLDGAPHVWVLTSSEGIRNLDTMARARFGECDDSGSGAAAQSRFSALKRAPVIVTHSRIAAAAVSAGFDTITNPGAGDANIVRAVLAASEQMAIQA